MVNFTPCLFFNFYADLVGNFTVAKMRRLSFHHQSLKSTLSRIF